MTSGDSQENKMIPKKTKIFIAGHKGMVGSAIWRNLESKGYTNLIGETREKLDLRNKQEVLAYFKKEQPIIVIDAAAKVGGILANNGFQYDFLIENLNIQNNLIDSYLSNYFEYLNFQLKNHIETHCLLKYHRL